MFTPRVIGGGSDDASIDPRNGSGRHFQASASLYLNVSIEINYIIPLVEIICFIDIEWIIFCLFLNSRMSQLYRLVYLFSGCKLGHFLENLHPLRTR